MYDVGSRRYKSVGRRFQLLLLQPSGLSDFTSDQLRCAFATHPPRVQLGGTVSGVVASRTVHLSRGQ
jgi:hypothetical protein